MCYLTTPRRRQWQPSPVFLPGKSHGRRSLVGCSPWGRCKSDTTKRLHFHFSVSCIGEGNGNPLQCSCLENPRDGGAWWAAVYGVAQSWTRLKRLSSSIYSWAEKEMATHSSVLAWRIPGIGEPGGVPSMGLHRAGHDWSNLAAAAAAYTVGSHAVWFVFHTVHLLTNKKALCLFINYNCKTVSAILLEIKDKNFNK